MTNSRLLLAATDGSSRSYLILPHAAAFARAINASLAVLQVAGLRDVDGRERVADAEAIATIEAAINRELKRLALDASALAVLRDEGEDVASAIMRVAAQKGADALALTSHGHGGLRQVLMGSVAAAVVQRSRLPVMVGGPSLGLLPAVSDIYRVVLTSDGSHASTEIVRALTPLVEGSKIAVELMRVFEHTPGDPPEEQQKAECEAQLRGLGALFPASLPVDIYVRQIVPLGGVDTAVIERAKETGAMAIALSTHGYTNRRTLVMGSTASLFVNRSPLPLILARGE